MDQTVSTQSEVKQNIIHRLRVRLRPLLPFTLGIVATFIALVAYNALFPPPPPITSRDVKDTIASAMASATPPPAFSTEVYQIIRPSLVLIQTKSPGKDGKSDNGLGSGVIVNANGDILTSYHVVDGASEIEVTFADGTQSKGAIVDSMPENDIAVLSAEQLPEMVIPAVLGNPGAMRVGDQVYAVGNPFGLYSSMSAGVISGFDRTFEPDNSNLKLTGLIQMDAAVNPGNSGGPLLNRDGQVIGIVEGIANPVDENFFVGIGFAVPINIAGGAAGLPPY